MPRSVHDEIWDCYVSPPTIAQGTFDDANGKYLGLEVGTDKWALVPGRRPPLIGADINGMLLQAKGRVRPGDSGSPGASAFLRGSFSPDHAAQMTHPPPIYTSSIPAEGGEGGPAVRQAPLSDSCYVACINYVGPAVGGTSGGFCTGNVWLVVRRYNNGVGTDIVRTMIDGWAHCQDHWYVALQAWGQNPVRLRVVTKAPTMYQVGATTWTSSPSRLTATTVYDHPVYGGIVVNQQLDEFYIGVQGEYSDWNTASVAPDDSAMAYPGDANYHSANPTRCWVVWEGVDASPQRLLSGNPGMRFAGGIYGGAKFTGYDITDRLTLAADPLVSGSTTVRGYSPGGFPALSAPGAVVGAITWDSGTKAYSATVSDLPSGVTTITASDGTDTATVEVEGPIEMPLAGASGTGSAPDLRLDVSEGLPLRDSATGKWVPIRWRVNGNPAFIRRS